MYCLRMESVGLTGAPGIYTECGLMVEEAVVMPGQR